MHRIESNFWEKTLNFDWDSFSNNQDDFKKAEIKCRAQVRKLRIIVNKFFVGKESIILNILLTSAYPVPDICQCLDVTYPEAYRVIFYVKGIVRELKIYFDKNTYKEVRYSLHNFLTDKQYKIFTVYIVTRSASITARFLGYATPVMIRSHIKKIDIILKDLTKKYEAYKDLFIAWRRIQKMRKVAYNSRRLKGEYIYLSELKTHEWKK